jgi:HEAT repeat protein
MRFSGLVFNRERVHPVLLAFFTFVSSPVAPGQEPGAAVEAGIAPPAVASGSGCVDLKPGAGRGSKVSARGSTQLANPSSNLESRMRVRWEGGKLSVSAEGVCLAVVLREVACRTGMEMQGAETLEEKVHAEFTALPLDEALRGLLAGVDYAVFGGLSSSQPVRRASLVILGGHGGADQTRARNAPPVPIRAGERAGSSEAGAPQPPPVVQEDEDELIKRIMSSDPTIQVAAFERLASMDSGRAIEAVEAAIKSGDSGARLQALQLLEHYPQADTDTVFSALRAALGDQDVNLKQFAVQALAGRGGSEAMDLLNQAFSTPDANVRLMVLESVADKKEGQSLLERAVSDPDQTVATSASALLDQQNSSTPQGLERPRNDR